MKHKNSFNYKSEKGVILFLSMVVMAILLSIGLALSAILIGQIRIMRGIGDSVIAFYAADTGIEKMLLYRNDPHSAPMPFNDSLTNTASYDVTVVDYDGVSCTVNLPDTISFCLRSSGTFHDVKRAIEVQY